MKKATRFLALVIALCMILAVSAFASGEASGGGMGPPAGGGAAVDGSADRRAHGWRFQQ